jgi:hypothetical protein
MLGGMKNAIVNILLALLLLAALTGAADAAFLGVSVQTLLQSDDSDDGC